MNVSDCPTSSHCAKPQDLTRMDCFSVYTSTSFVDLGVDVRVIAELVEVAVAVVCVAVVVAVVAVDGGRSR